MILLAVLISNAMFYMLGYMYHALTSVITSAPVGQTLIVYSIPFILAIFVCLLCAYKWKTPKKMKKSKKS